MVELDQFQTFLEVCYDKNVQVLKENFSNISIVAQFLNAPSPDPSLHPPPSPSHHLEPPPASSIVYPPLLFTVQNLFLIGSPLGMFLTSKFPLFFPFPPSLFLFSPEFGINFSGGKSSTSSPNCQLSTSL